MKTQEEYAREIDEIVRRDVESYQKVEGFGGTRYGFPYRYISFYDFSAKWYIIT